MKLVSEQEIQSLSISPLQCIEWVNESFCMKYDSILPEKISIKLDGNIFYNTMPSFLTRLNRFGVKIVSRYPTRKPSICGEISLYNGMNGELLSIMDASWITTMRTGAVAALTIHKLQKSNTEIYAIMGLGSTAIATLECLSAIDPNKALHIRILSYKKQAEEYISHFKDYPNIHFEIANTTQELITNADVVISCVTAMDDIVADDRYYKEGVLVVPVHTRGFQNCDLFFDRCFCDDKGHISSFKYYDKLKNLDETSNILLGKNPGRQSDKERILAYNIGISLHDIYFASKIYDLLENPFSTV